MQTKFILTVVGICGSGVSVDDVTIESIKSVRNSSSFPLSHKRMT